MLVGEGGEEKVVPVNKVKLLMIGTRFDIANLDITISTIDFCFVAFCRAYKRAVELEPESACLWYDVAISYFYTAQVISPTHLL